MFVLCQITTYLAIIYCKLYLFFLFEDIINIFVWKTEKRVVVIF